LQKSGAKLQIRDQRARRTQALESADDAESGLRSQRASGKVRMNFLGCSIVPNIFIRIRGSCR
jgi:hypothetical protein